MLASSGFRLGYSPALDGLRAICVLLVVFHHLQLPGFVGGSIGVDGFFVLSGFLITTLLLQEWQQTARIDLRAFYLRRALRLLPALFVLVLAVSAWTFWVYREDLDSPLAQANMRGAWASLLYVANWVRAIDTNAILDPLGTLGHTWSLAIEEQFYLIWPLLLIFLLARRVPLRRLVIGLVVAITSIALARPVLVALDVSEHRIYAGTDTRADALLIGCLLALLLMHLPLARFADPRLRGALWLTLPPVAALCVFVPHQNPIMSYGGYSLVALCAALIILEVILFPEGAAARILSWRPLVLVGVTSYGIYLWHHFIFTSLVTPASWPGWQRNGILLLLTAFAVVLSYRYLERPMLRLKSRLAVRSRTPEREPAVLLARGAAK